MNTLLINNLITFLLKAALLYVLKLIKLWWFLLKVHKNHESFPVQSFAVVYSTYIYGALVATVSVALIIKI